MMTTTVRQPQPQPERPRPTLGRQLLPKLDPVVVPPPPEPERLPRLLPLEDVFLRQGVGARSRPPDGAAVTVRRRTASTTRRGRLVADARYVVPVSRCTSGDVEQPDHAQAGSHRLKMAFKNPARTKHLLE